MDEQERPATHDEPRQDLGAGKLGWAYIAALALPVLGFFVLGLAGAIVGLVIGVGVFAVLRR
jgi:hypothetical protein